MARQTGTYVYGTEAVNWEAQPIRRREEEIRRRERQEQRRKPRPKQKIDKVAVFLVILTFAAVLGIGLAFLQIKFQATYLNRNVVELQKEVVEMEKQNTTAQMELDNSVDLQAIYKKATKKLGMKMAKSSQIFTYESRKSTQVRQHGSVPTE